MVGPNNSSRLRLKTSALNTPRTMRRHSARGITSIPAGKMTPIAAFPLLREDALRSGRISLNFEMMETAEILMNAINVRVRAYLIPLLALARFNGSLDQFNLSYEGLPPLEGEPVVPFIETAVAGAHGANEVYKYLGLHARPTQLVNTAYLESYNLLWNFLAANRSPDLIPRARLATSLAPAFWNHERFSHIVPDFDQAVIDGEVPLNVTGGRLAVEGIGFVGVAQNGANIATARATKGNEAYNPGYNVVSVQEASAAGQAQLAIKARAGGFADIWAELEQDGITVSLSNIELARKTQAFARLRQEYNAHDDYIISLLMDGVSIPDQMLKQPMLLADRSTIFGMAKRYASDGASLTESVVNGATGLDIALNVPRLNTGGIVLIVAEITPDQLFERQEEPFFHTLSATTLPQYLRDELDPEKVDVVKNGRIDTDHDTPDATFGYEPLNARWNVDTPRIGGRFYRPAVDAGFDEDRQRIWAVETQNPTLSTDFYLCTQMHTKPFVVTNQDPFEVVTQGDVYIEGNTVFGGALVEANEDYAKILEVAPQARIDKD